MDRTAAREISYASSARGRGGRTLIRLLENATGRPSLLRRARGYDAQVGQGADRWDVLSDRFGLSLAVTGGALGDIPATGPLVLVANHPYAILDGLTLGRILSQRRAGDFRILANSVFNRAADINRFILPINFDDTRDAVCRTSRPGARRSIILPGVGRSVSFRVAPSRRRQARCPPRSIRCGAALPPR